MSVINFDASTVKPSAPPEAVPAAWYNIKIIESEQVPTSTPGGEMIRLVHEIIDGPYAGKRLFDQLNVVNANPVAVQIAYETLSAICHATGVIQLQDTGMLHNRPLQARAVLVPAGKGSDGNHYDASNDVKGYKALEGAVPAQIIAAPAQTATPAGPGPAAPAGPGPAPAPAADVKYKTADGEWTKDQLLAAKYTEEQIAALPQVGAPAASTEPAAASTPWQHPAADASAAAKPPWVK